jgi:hypothetical protein
VRRLSVLLLFLSLPAAAQQMPDVRDMSGKSRPDQAVAAGTITVKVIQGDLGSLAAEGTPVHLVGVDAKGKLSNLTQKVNDEGRAEFTGLATDGGTVYWALCLLGEDRLESEQITLPPKVGVRLALAGRKHGPDGKPVGAPVDDEKAQDPQQPLPPAGEVDVSVRGRVPAKSRLLLRQIGAAGEPLAAELIGPDGNLSASFKGVAGGADKVYIAEVGAEGRLFRSSPFMLAAAGARRMILAHDKLLLAFQGGGQVDDDDMGFELSLVVANLTGVPYDAGAEGVLVPLPLGFTSAQVKDDDPAKRASIESGAGVRLRGVVPPGQRETVVQFALPIRDGRVSFEMPAPLGIFQSQMFIAKSGGMVLAPRDGVTTAPKIERADDGREYYALSDVTVAPGGTLAFEVAGLPVPAKWQDWGRALAGVIVIVLVALAVVVAARRPRPGRRAAAPAQRRQELYARRDRLYAELVALERARAAGRIDLSAFDAQRKGIMTKLVLVHRELDELDAPGPGGTSAGSQPET